VLPNDRQFRETLKKEWKKGNVNDDRIIALAKNAGADYLCLARITSILGSNQIAMQLVNLKSEPMDYSDMGIARGKLEDVESFAKKIQEAVNDMLRTAKSSPPKIETPKTFTDKRDGKQYEIVKIGNQTWMAENLGYNASGSKCYDNNESNCKKYGRLYDWATAKKACPAGWHLPSNGEWDILVNFVGGEKIAGKKLKATKGWNYDDENGKTGNGTDEFGFSALPGGGGSFDGSFGDVGYGIWWSASEHNSNYAHRRIMGYGEAAIYYYHNKDYMFSVRCVKD